MTWQERVLELHQTLPEGVKPPWRVWANKLSHEYGLSLSPDALRSAWRRRWRIDSLRENKKSVVEAPAKSQGDLTKNLLANIEKGASFDGLCKTFGLSRRIIEAHIEDLKESGYDISIDGDFVALNKQSFIDEKNEVEQNWTGRRKIKFGLIGDTHLGSKSQQLTHCNTMYDIFADREVADVYHAGDLVDGEDVYPGHRYEIFKVGADEQKRYAIENYPRRNGVTTHFITGNHDLKYYQKMGLDIGVAIAGERQDMNYLGQYFAKVWITPRCSLQLEHPLGKPAYAVSYKTQRKIDNMRGGDKPNILVEGHYHYHVNLFRRNVHAFCVPSFQGPTNLSRRLGLESDNGAFIVELEVDETGDVKSIKSEFFPFYVFIPDDY
jgi:biotin operon repressor/predicted phosphodiesterase